MSRLNRMDRSSEPLEETCNLVPRKSLSARVANDADDGDGVKEGALASDALPLPMALTNKFFFLLFIAATVFLLHRWDEMMMKKKKWNTMTRATHSLTLPDLIALLAFVASLVYLWGFFGIVYVQNLIHTSTISEDLDRDEEGERNLVKNGQVRDEEGEKNLVKNGQVYANENGQDIIIRANLPIGQGFCVEETYSDEDIALAVNAGLVPIHTLETELGPERGAVVRNRAVEIMTGRSLRGLALRSGFDYSSVLGQCCEMVIGHVSIPVGVAGPLLLDGREYMVPMASTEGCLVASTNRGCKAILMSGGATSILLKDGMTRAPLVRFKTALRAYKLKSFLEQPDNFENVAIVFNKTSRFARLQSVQGSLAGRNLYIRFVCSTGDAMGMNMISKGVQNVLHYLEELFPDMEVLSISGNMCADKKATSVNWIHGRGKSVVCEAIIKEDVVAKVLKTSVPDLIELNVLKNLVGSSIAGAVGGFNAHASNIVTALFIATGQDPAQNVESSQCITLMEPTNNGRDLYISVTMPTMEVGTIGGGTQLAAQSACLNLLGVKGSNVDCPGANAQCLARIIGGAVLAGELSLMSALTAGHLVKSHMKYNRSRKNTHNE